MHLGTLLAFLLFSIFCVDGKLHHLELKNEIRKNVLLSKFGFNENGTMAFAISDFTLPTELSNNVDKFVSIYLPY
jgi:hypothetical protein